MRNRLLSGTAIGVALALTLPFGRDAGAACDTAPTTGDDTILCVPGLPPGDIDLLAGNDTITFDGVDVGIGAPQTVTGATGNDSIVGYNGASIGLLSGYGAILGATGDDLLSWDGLITGFGALFDGGTGNDTVHFGDAAVLDNVTALGSAGNDTLSVGDAALGSQGDVTLDGGTGDDAVVLVGTNLGVSSSTQVTVGGGLGADSFELTGVIVGESGVATLDGGQDDDVFTFTTNNQIGGSVSSHAVVLGGGGDDTFEFTGAGNDIGGYGAGATLDMGSGNDLLDLSGGLTVGAFGNGTILGGEGDDEVRGNLQVGLFDQGVVYGGAGDDAFDLESFGVAGQLGLLGTQSEAIIGLDEGNDTFAVSTSTNIVTDGRLTMTGGTGDDTFTLSAASGLATFIVPRSGGEVTFDTGSGNDTFAFAGSGVASVQAESGSEVTINLGAGDDSFGFFTNGAFAAETGSQALLLAGEGNDTLQFLDANIYAVQDGAVTVDAGDGNDTFVMTGTATDFAGLTGNLSSEALITTGDGDDSLLFSRVRMAINGTATVDAGSGDDTISFVDGLISSTGLLPADTGWIRGGSGQDDITLSNAQLGVNARGIVSGDDGDDSIRFDSGALGGSETGEGSVLGGQGTDTLWFSDVVMGAGGAALADGGDGNDTLVFDEASQFALVGAAASATVLGGLGSDSLVISGTGVDNAVVGLAGSATLDMGAGDDEVAITLAILGQAASSSVTLFTGTGSDSLSFDSVTIAQDGDVIVDTGDGADGDRIDISNSQIAANAVASFSLGGGNDTVNLTNTSIARATTPTPNSATFALGDDDDLLTMVGGTVSEGVSGAASFVGNEGSDTLAFSGVVLGQAGDVLVDGGTGADDIRIVGDSRLAVTNSSLVNVLGGLGSDRVTIDATVAVDGAVTLDLGSDASADTLMVSGSTFGEFSQGLVRAFAGGGDDTMTFASSVVAKAGSVSLDAGDGNDSLTFDDSDLITQVGGDATLWGGAGLDLFRFSASDLGQVAGATLFGGDDADTLRVLGGSRIAVNAAASVYFEGAAGADQVTLDASTVGVAGDVTLDLGGDGSADHITANGSTFAEALTSRVLALAGGGDDTLAFANSIVALAGQVSLDASDGDDSLTFDGGDVAAAADGDATLWGGEGTDLFRLSGNDFAVAGGATVFGGTGADSFRALGGSRLAVDAAANVYFEGALGADQVTLDNSTVAVAGTVTLDFGNDGSAEHLTATGSTFAEAITARVLALAGDGNDTLAFANSVVAVAGQVSLDASDGDDSLTFDGSDVAAAAGGDATLWGGEGADRFAFSASDFAVAGGATAFGGTGVDLLEARAGSRLAGAAGSTAFFYGGLGEDQVTIDASAVADAGTALVDGADGNDRFVVSGASAIGNQAGGSGTLNGGTGDDQFVLAGGVAGAAAGASGSLLGGAGADSFDLTGGTLGGAGSGLVEGGAEVDVFTLGSAFTMGGEVGGGGTLTGDDGNDTLTALAAVIGDSGSATIAAGEGDDSLDFDGTRFGQSVGGSGTAAGGTGSDTFVFRGGANIGAAGSGLVDAGLGADSVTLDASGLGAGGSGTVTGGEGDDDLLVRNGSAVGTGGGGGTLAGGAGGDDILVTGSSFGAGARVLGEAGNDTLEFSLASLLAGGAMIDLGNDDDRLRLEDSTAITGGIAVEGGAGNDRLELHGSTSATFATGSTVTNFETLQKTGMGTWNWDVASAVFTTVALDEGTFVLLDETLTGATTILAPATLAGTGTLVGNLGNAGRIVPAGAGAIGTLTVQGDYAGGGFLALDVTLGADDSPADLLRVTGATSGVTTVQVANLGGAGGQTEDNGILVIEVGTAGGTTSDGNFVLDGGGPVAVGMFEYDLVLREDGNWYLVNELAAATVDLTLGGSAAIAAWHAGLRSVDERLGELRQLVGPTLEPGQTASRQTAGVGYGDGQLALRESVVERPLSGWLRVGGAFDDYGSAVGAPFSQTTVAVQGGFDGGVRGVLTGGDLLLAGIFATMTQAQAEVHGTATELNLEGWGGGLYATYLWQGLYLDAVVKGDAFDLDYSIPDIDTEASQDALALGASLEVGWRFELGGGYFLEPQAQLSYLKVELSDLEDLQDDTDVLFEDAQSLRGRVGLKLGATLDVEGTAVRPYAEISGLREFLGETEATIGDNLFTSELEGNAVEVGLGVSVTDKTGHLSLFVDGDYVQGDVGTSVQVQAGIRISW